MIPTVFFNKSADDSETKYLYRQALYTFLHKIMDGWIDGWIDGWMDGRTDGWMDGWMDGWRDRGRERERETAFSVVSHRHSTRTLSVAQERGGAGSPKHPKRCAASK